MKKELTSQERKVLYKVIEIIEGVQGGYTLARPIVEKLEKEFGLKENPNFTVYRERFFS